MLTFEKFSGINNQTPERRHSPGELKIATNVDIGITGEISRRAGYSEVDATCHKNLWQGDGFMLATITGSDLVNVETDAVLSASLGASRVWYLNLPDGRTVFSNGLVNGITDGATTTGFGVPVPATTGSPTGVPGDLYPGEYSYAIAYERLSDGLEGGAVDGGTVELEGGVTFFGLPSLAGYRINVYLSSHNDDQRYYAGSTTSAMFSFTGGNDELVIPCRSMHMEPAPVGTLMAFYRSRVLVAKGSVLYASQPDRWELFDPADFKQFSAPITLVQAVDDGVYVGTEEELAFLSGAKFDELTYSRVGGPVVLGSGVRVNGDLIKQGNGVGSGTAMVCICEGIITAGFNSGGVIKMTEGRYKTDVSEVHALFRMNGELPQYLAL